jgi:hypothetical protein
MAIPEPPSNSTAFLKSQTSADARPDSQSEQPDYSKADDRTRRIVDNAALILSRTYALERRRIGNFYKFPDHTEAVWQNLAKKVLLNNIDPSHYVKTVCGYNAKAPFPAILSGAVNIDRYLANRRDVDPADVAAKAIEYMMNVAAVNVRGKRTIPDIVHDRFLPLSDAARCAIAHSAGLIDLAAEFQQAAFTELETRPHHLKILSPYLPKSLVECLNQ